MSLVIATSAREDEMRALVQVAAIDDLPESRCQLTPHSAAPVEQKLLASEE
jgi:hypothetical protein